MKYLIFFIFLTLNDFSRIAQAGPVTADESPSLSETKSNSKTNNKTNIKKREISNEEKIEPDIVNLDDQKGILAGLDYPELQVVPRASERLIMEAQEEKGRTISPYWPVQLSAISLILTGIYSTGKYTPEGEKKENQMSTQLAVLAGSLWLGSTLYLTNVLSYTSEFQDIKKITGKDKKSQLLKERLSEEALERPARVAYMINTMSVWSSLACSLYVATHSSPATRSYTNLSIALSFLPWIIDNRITMNWEKHQEYKRKIYAPLSMGTLQFNDTNKKWEPQLTLNWTF